MVDNGEAFYLAPSPRLLQVPTLLVHAGDPIFRVAPILPGQPLPQPIRFGEVNYEDLITTTQLAARVRHQERDQRRAERSQSAGRSSRVEHVFAPLSGEESWPTLF